MRKYIKIMAVCALVLTGVLFLAACNLFDGGNKTETLDKPENLRITNFILTWSEVENASGYTIDLGSASIDVTEPTYDLAKVSEIGTHEIRVKAKGDKSKYSESGWSLPEMYEVKATEGLQFEEVNGGYSVSKGTTKDLIIIIPSTYEGLAVTEVKELAFDNCQKIISVFIPDSVKTIGKYAFFHNHDLRNIIIGDGVTTIGDGAFYACKKLASIEIPTSVTTIGGFAFRECIGLVEAEIPDTVSSVGVEMFFGCASLARVKLGTGVTEIKKGFFYECSALKEVTMPDSLTAIAQYAFYYCSGLTNVKIPDSVTTVGESAFIGCSRLESMEIPFVGESKSSSGNKAIIGFMFGAGLISSNGEYTPSSLKAITITSATSIAESAFYGCVNIQSIILPSSVTDIGASAFSGCSNLTIYTEAQLAGAGWHENWNNSNRPVIWGNILSAGRSYVVSFTKIDSSVSNPAAPNGIFAPYRYGYVFEGWATSSGSTKVAYLPAVVSTAPNGTVLYAVWTAQV